MSNPWMGPASPEFGGSSSDAPNAELGDRFLAKVIDGLLGVLAMVPGIIGIFMFVEPGRDEPNPGAILGGLIVVIGALALQIYQWYLISTEGQTVGKQVMGIRIVKVDGSSIDFVYGVILRVWVPGFIVGIGNQLCIGWLFQLVDVLMIFGEERRCLHDQVAGTRVVVA